jgi:hypothetical protein
MTHQTQIVHFALQRTAQYSPNFDSIRENVLALSYLDVAPTVSLRSYQVMEEASPDVSPFLTTMIQGDLVPRSTCCETRFLKEI